MAALISLGIGLSILFGCIFLGLVAEVSHLLLKKKKKRNENPNPNNNSKGIFPLFCCKNPNSVDTIKTQQIPISKKKNPDPNDLELGPPNDFLPDGEEESVESELKRLHNLCGPPRFLFTINEETSNDFESDDGRSRGGGERSKSLSELDFGMDTPIVLTPMASPKLKVDCPFEAYQIRGLNPLFESCLEAELAERLGSSPPPTFKFLRDAEEKFKKRLMEEAERRVTEEREDSFVRTVVGKNREREPHEQLPLHNSEVGVFHRSI